MAHFESVPNKAKQALEDMEKEPHRKFEIMQYYMFAAARATCESILRCEQEGYDCKTSTALLMRVIEQDTQELLGPIRREDAERN